MIFLVTRIISIDNLINHLLADKHILEIGEYAQRLLSSGQRGKVLAAFSQGIYLHLRDDELIWVGGRDIPMHRRGLKSSHMPAGVATGSSVTVENGSLYIGSEWQADLSRVVIWQAPRISIEEALSLQDVADQVKNLVEYVSHLPDASGFGRFLPELCGLITNKSGMDVREPDNAVDRIARPLILKIAHALVGGRISAAWSKLGSLVGLGEGLTPSGDDFLGGLFFSLQYLRKCYPVYDTIPDPAMFVEGVKGKTNLISYTIFKDLSLGHGIFPIHQLFIDLLTQKPPTSHLKNGFCSVGSDETAAHTTNSGIFEIASSRLQEAIIEIIKIGHSTGWDLLTGLLVGLCIVFPEANKHRNSPIIFGL